VSHIYDGGWEFTVGGGVAVFDCDGDGRPDLFIAGGKNQAALYHNDSKAGEALHFTRVTNSGLEVDSVIGAYPIDIDGDGKIDLVVLRVGETFLFRGLGNCRFERANEAWGFDGGNAWTTAFSAFWEKGNDWPTLALGRYVDRGKPGAPFGTCHDNLLYRPAKGRSGFAPPIKLAPGYCSLSMLFSDWNRSGSPDLMVTNDRQYYQGGEDQLWRIRPGEPPVLYGRSDGWRPLQIWGMGIASYDITGTGYPGYFLTSMGDNKLRVLAGGPTRPAFTDVALARGVTAHRPFTGGDFLPSTAWHAEFSDVNNDGLIDLFITKGNVDAMEEAAHRDPSNLLLGRAGGRFVEAADRAGILNFARARGAALVDFNLDGMLDLVVVNLRENVKIWRNVGFGTSGHPQAMGNWLELRLRQPGGNRDAIGAWIEVRAGSHLLRREVTIGGGHAGGQLGWIHFGLGPAADALVRVQWPDGEWGAWVRVPSNQFAYLDRGARQAVLWRPP
jgi:enediyne biosynthesis protein E4